MIKIDKRLTPNFKISELMVSKDHPELVSELWDFANINDERNMFFLCYLLLQPIRKYYGMPLIITSGFRTPNLNVKVGGSENSNHLTGSAADFTVADKTLLPKIYEWLKYTKDDTIGELIYHKKDGFIHVALPKWNEPIFIKEV